MALCGLINANKPSGVTSRRIVDRVARLAGPAKVGHAGTLDPLASGVLVIGIGQATRLVEYVQRMPKTYRAEFLLGRTSTTEDVEGEITLLDDAPRPTLDELARAAGSLVGTIEQRPPAFSALKVEGRRAYALARAGQSVELAPRSVRIDRLEVTGYEYPTLSLEIECGSGTYVRSLGRDLAQRVGTGAVMSALVRTAIGPFEIASAVDVDTLTRETLAAAVLPAVLAVSAVDERAGGGRCRRGATGQRAVDRVAAGAVDRAGRDLCGNRRAGPARRHSRATRRRPLRAAEILSWRLNARALAGRFHCFPRPASRAIDTFDTNDSLRAAIGHPGGFRPAGSRAAC